MMGLRRGRKIAEHTIVDVNLLPSGLRPADVSPVAVAIVVALAIGAVALAPLASVEHSARKDADTIARQSKEAQASLNTIQLAVSRNRALQAQIEATKAKRAALQKVREQLQRGKRPLWDDFSHLIDPSLVPPGSRITTVTGTDTGLRVDGTAAAPLDAIAYAGRLAQEGGFPSARLASFAPGKAGGQFTIEVTR